MFFALKLQKEIFITQSIMFLRIFTQIQRHNFFKENKIQKFVENDEDRINKKEFLSMSEKGFGPLSYYGVFTLCII